MFASFELRPEGLTRAEPRPKLIRDADGCLPCRRKRKRCDKTKPACLRCRNSTNRDLCTWPQMVKKQRTDLEHDISNASEASYASTPAATSGKELEFVEQWWKASALSSPKLNSKELSALSFVKFPDCVAKVSPELSLANLVEISVGFQRKLLCGKDEYEPSMLLMGFRPTNMCPSLIHAWAACSIAAVAPPSSEWQQRALLHHSNALIEMRKSIEEGSAGGTAEEAACEAEGRRATVLMLHIFEVQSHTRHGNTKLATSHLNAAHRIFTESMMTGGPSSLHDLLLLEGYILRTALNILFIADIQLPLDFIDLALGRYKVALKTLNVDLNLKQCPWLGPLGYDMIEKIYRLSWLAHKIPLRGERMVELIAITRSLAVLKLPDHYGTDQYYEAGYLVRTVKLWKSHVIACQLLASWIADPDQQMDNLQQDQQFTAGMKLLDEASQHSKLCMPVLWPLNVFSMMLSTPKELTMCQNIAERARRSAGEGVVNRILGFQNDLYALRLSGSNVRAKDLLALVSSDVVFL